MPVEEREELARELSEFGYSETSDPDVADARNYYKVEKWDAGGLHVERSCTRATIFRGPERSSWPRGSAGRAAATRSVRASACSNAGHRIERCYYEQEPGWRTAANLLTRD